MAPMDAIWLFLVGHSLCPALCGYPPMPTLPSFLSASGIGQASKKLSKKAGNLASYLLNSW